MFHSSQTYLTITLQSCDDKQRKISLSLTEFTTEKQHMAKVYCWKDRRFLRALYLILISITGNKEIVENKDFYQNNFMFIWTEGF